jgi:hypothetical protein
MSKPVIVILPNGDHLDVESATYKAVFVDHKDEIGESHYAPVKGGQVSWWRREGALRYRYGCHVTGVTWDERNDTTVCEPGYGEDAIILLETTTVGVG